MHPIPKSSQSDPRIPLNHMGISLQSVISKLYTSALNVRLNRYSEGKGCIVKEQNGFREGRCCLDHIFALHNLLKVQKENNDQIFCALLTKHSTEWIETLCFTDLKKNGLTGKFYHAIKALYKTSKSSVQINSMASESFYVTNRVRQGDSLPITLFSIYLNDLATEIKYRNMGIPVADICIYLLLYAGDIVTSVPNEEKLQSMFNVVNKWCRT